MLEIHLQCQLFLTVNHQRHQIHIHSRYPFLSATWSPYFEMFRLPSPPFYLLFCGSLLSFCCFGFLSRRCTCFVWTSHQKLHLGCFFQNLCTGSSHLHLNNDFVVDKIYILSQKKLELNNFASVLNFNNSLEHLTSEFPPHASDVS